MSYDNIVLYIGDDVKSVMEQNGVREDEVKMVVGAAEESGLKLKEEEGNRFLAKLKIADVYYYAEYEPEGDGFRIIDAYWHKTFVTGW
ncbi:hypothetical protein LPY66_08090 [Dehalobacter sp. DCM]|uniref:hypothetical protein n=1 Tax=Dehalobacter sp. DCM TaxID=2907827 RepID=UPI0030813F1E|nr:hypothetical protein LPY66_08090 [Dehalobacter sp. DCM]